MDQSHLSKEKNITTQKQPNLWERATFGKKEQLVSKSSPICGLAPNLATLHIRIRWTENVLFCYDTLSVTPESTYTYTKCCYGNLIPTDLHESVAVILQRVDVSYGEYYKL